MTVDQLIETIRKSRQHRHLYHFTDRKNLPSIKKKGLVSKKRMRAEGWWPVAPGGNKLSHDLDTHLGIDRYVSLCFTNGHPMLHQAKKKGRLKDSVYLKISPEIIKAAGTLISFGVANAANARHVPVPEAVREFDVKYLEVLYNWTNWSDPEVNRRLQTAQKFEILVPDIVPKDMIVGVLDG